MQMASVHCGYWKPCESWDCRKKQKYTRLPLPNCMDWCSKCHKARILPFIHAALMQWPNYMLTGSVLTTGRHTICLSAMEYFLIMKVLSGVKHLLRVRSHAAYQQSLLDCRIVYTSATWKREETG